MRHATFGRREFLVGFRVGFASVLVAGASVAVFGELSSAPAGATTSPCGTHGAFSSVPTRDSCTYTRTGEDTFSVPPTVDQVTVAAIGGAGGAGASGGEPGGLGGQGAEVSATVTVSGGSKLYAEVGSDGALGTSGPSCSGGAGGANGGGDGGAAYCSLPDSVALPAGGGGGGASDVRTTPAADGGLTGGAGDPRLVVAGGGGGGGGQDAAPGGAGGNAGDSSVTGAGDGGNCSSGDQANPGDPGGVGAGGGTGGIGTGPCGAVADNVSDGGNGGPTSGGAGGDGATLLTTGPGGGGGGYVGGGGGATSEAPQFAAGGGGGSSFGPATAIVATTSSAPSVTISWALLYVLHVTPSTGPSAGGTKFSIAGTGFATGAVVKIGQGHGAGSDSLEATQVKVVSSDEITAITPKGAAGTWNVFVLEPHDLQSPPHPADRFTYTT